MRLPPAVPTAPLPVGESKSETSGMSSWRSLAAATIASARGCSDARSTPAANPRISSSEKPAIATIAVTEGRPSVRSEEHTSELQSLMRISYAVFCLKKKTNITTLYKTYTQQLQLYT